MLTATTVTFAFGKHVAVNDVSLTLNPREFVGLIGPNGSGKTSLIALLMGARKPANGTISLLGDDITSLTRDTIARRVTVVPQDTRIDFGFTVREVVAMGRTPYLGALTPEGESDRVAIDEAMRAADVFDFASRIVTELSGGERQRVHLARALAQQTPILLLDEPTASLDVAHQFDLLERLRALAHGDDARRKGRAVLASMHDLTHAARFCDRLMLLDRGSLIADGSPHDVLTRDNLRAVFGVEGSFITHPATQTPHLHIDRRAQH